MFSVEIKTLDEMFQEYGRIDLDHPDIMFGWSRSIDRYLPPNRIIALRGPREASYWTWNDAEHSGSWTIGSQMIKRVIEENVAYKPPDPKAYTPGFYTKIISWATPTLIDALNKNEPCIYLASQAIEDPTKISFFNKAEHARDWQSYVEAGDHSQADDYRKKRAVMTRPGRFFNKFGIKDPQTLEVITSRFSSFVFEILEGEDIRKAYHMHNYTQEEQSNLHSSCMKYESCQGYFDFYVDHLKMVVARDHHGRILGRAILWENMHDCTRDQNITFLDRIYGSEIFTHSLKAYAKIQGWHHKTKQNYTSHRRVTTPEGEELTLNMVYKCNNDYDYYPYMDTMNYHAHGLNFNNSGDGENLEDTEGNENPCCVHCNSSVAERYYSPDGELYCEECYNDLFGICENCTETFLKDDLYCTVDGCTYCPDCLSTRAVECEVCGDLTSNENTQPLDGEVSICNNCAQLNADYPCPICHEPTPLKQILREGQCTSCIKKEETNETPIS